MSRVVVLYNCINWLKAKSCRPVNVLNLPSASRLFRKLCPSVSSSTLMTLEYCIVLYCYRFESIIAHYIYCTPILSFVNAPIYQHPAPPSLLQTSHSSPLQSPLSPPPSSTDVSSNTHPPYATLVYHTCISQTILLYPHQ